MTTPLPPPTLVVVGRTNKGKSSVVSTISEVRPGRTLAIGERPGTTRDARVYPVEVDGEVVLNLVDTPGLEEAPRAREWLIDHAATAADRPAALELFVNTFKGADEFQEEVRALEPIVNGGGILYVVDGTQPYRPRHEAEMEVLQWAARPRLALINRIRHSESDDGSRVEKHITRWKAALRQYFPTVIEFDAHHATFERRIEMLETLAALDDTWRAPMKQAIQAFQAQRRQRNLDSAVVVSDMIFDAISYTAEVTLEPSEPAERRKGELREAFHDKLVNREAKARRQIENLYAQGHFDAEVGVEEAEVQDGLFVESSWKTFGLSPRGIVALSTASGALAGGVIDASVGGASFGAGLALGGLAAGGTALYQLGRRFAEVTVDRGMSGMMRAMKGERRLRIGPHPNPNFAWVLLDRALAHLDVVRNWAHARPTDDASRVIEAHVGRVEGLSDKTKRRLHALLLKIRKKQTPELRAELARELTTLIGQDE